LPHGDRSAVGQSVGGDGQFAKAVQAAHSIDKDFDVGARDRGSACFVSDRFSGILVIAF